MRDHKPIKIEEFNGLWRRGGNDSCPYDHFTDCNNVEFEESSVKVRKGLETYLPYPNIVRVRVFNQSLLILDANGNLFHTDRQFPLVPILSIPGMTDFGFTKFANRAYITPNGMNNEFVYVYGYGSSNPARKAGGLKPVNSGGFSFSAANSPAAGNVEQGIHIFAVVYLTDTGFLTALGPNPFAFVDAPGEFSVDLTDVPISPQVFVRERWICATKAIDPAEYTGNLEGYQFFFIPDGRINDNITTVFNVSFFDADLLDDASHLFDLLEEIPNCAGLNTYHGRIIAWAFPQGNVGENLSLVRISFPGEPEAFSEIDGLITLERDGKPINYCQEYRDLLYIFKSTKTYSTNDNQDVPSSWPLIIIDDGVGCSGPNSMTVVMDDGSITAEYLIVACQTGILLFNGSYIQPELTWKIKDFWNDLDRPNLYKIQVAIQTLEHMIYVILPDGTMLIGDYSNGLSPKDIKWSPWSFDINAACVAILEDVSDIKVIIGAQEIL